MLNTKLLLKSVMAMAVASLMVFTTGCEDDDKDAPTGTSTVRGEVSAVSADYVPGIVAGITVHLVGPVTLKTISDARGIFEFTNVPAGDYVLIFYVNGGQATKEITIGEGETTVLAHVTVKASGEVVVTTDVKAAPAPAPEPEAPAIINVAGTWQVSLAMPGIDSPRYQLALKQDGTALSGSMEERYIKGGSIRYTVTGSITGTAVELTLTPQSLPSRMSYIETMSGTVNAGGTAMSGTFAGEGSYDGTWAATPGEIDG